VAALELRSREGQRAALPLPSRLELKRGGSLGYGMHGQNAGEHDAGLAMLDGLAVPLPAASLVERRRVLGEHP
jgi:hypothetical protein